jgi:peptidoglycan hydrolase CwlO-like protein
MPNAEVVLSRQKRLALLALGWIAVFSVAVTTTVGVSTTALVKNANVKSSLETLQAKQEEMLERISTLEDNYEKVKKIISLLQSEIEGIGYQIKGITDSLKSLQNNLPSFMICVSFSRSFNRNP